jgi:hypothetical protein
MWVSKAAWDRVQQRLKELEEARNATTDNTYFTVYEPTSQYANYMYRPASQFISVKSVVEELCRQVGIKLVYEAGTPARVAFAAKEQPQPVYMTGAPCSDCRTPKDCELYLRCAFKPR